MPAWTKLLPWALLLGACAESGTLASGGTAPPRPDDDDDLWSMVPAEADLVLWADLAKLRASPWTRESFEKIAPSETAAGLGAEQLRTVDRVVLAKVPSLADDASILVARGTIDRAALIKAFGKEGEVKSGSYYRGADLVVRGEESIAFVGRRTALSGLTIAVRAALDCNFGVAATVESQSWFRQMRGELARKRDAASLVAALYVHPQPATREALMREMGEGGTLQDFAARVDLAADLDVAAWAAVTTEAEARDLAGRLGERLHDVRVRPIVAAFGFAGVLDSVRLEVKGTLVSATVHVSQSERADIAVNDTATAEMMTKLHDQEKQRP